MPLLPKTEKIVEPVAPSGPPAEPVPPEKEAVPDKIPASEKSPAGTSPAVEESNSLEQELQMENRRMGLRADGTRDPKKWGRRTADKLGPILEKIVGVLSSGSINESFFNLSKDIEDILGCEAVRIYSIDRQKKELYSRNYISEDVEEIRWDISKKNLAGYAAGTGKAIYISDIESKEELAKYEGLHYDSLWDKRLNKTTNSAIVIPLAHNNRLVGVFEILNKKDGEPFTLQEYDLAQEASRKLAQVLDKLEREDTEDLIKSIALAIHRASATEAILEEVRKPILDLFQAEWVTIYEVDAPNKELFSKIKDPDTIGEIRMPLDHTSICGWVAEKGERINIMDVYDETRLHKLHPDLTFNREWDKKSGLRTRSMLAAPLIYDEKTLGVIQVVNKNSGEGFNEMDERNIQTISELMGIAFHNQQKLIGIKPSRYSYLVANGIITPDELNKAIVKARTHKMDVEEILLDQLQLSRADLGKSLEDFYQLPYFGYDSSIILPKECFCGINKSFLKTHYIVPVRNEEDRVVILTNNPQHRANLKSIQRIFRNKKIGFKVGLKRDILDFLEYASLEGSPGGRTEVETEVEVEESGLESIQSEEVASLLSALQEEQTDEDALFGTDEDDDSNAISDTDSTIVRLVNKIIIDAYDQGVSDIHVEPGTGRANLLVRFRKDGECDIYQEIPHQYKRALISRIKIISKLDIAEKRLPQDGKIKMKYGKKEIELRVATCPTVGGNEDVVMRILASSKPIPLDQMKFSERNLNLIKQQVMKPYGLILVVGPTGSGKTTTLHSTLAYINTPKKKIWTAEDPVEITQAGLRQVQMHTKIGLDFARAMRSFLRGDPDVIMVGEMRDVETCAIGLEASLTGHLVFSTLHTNSAPETITRLLDMGMNPLNFADALLLIVAQRLGKTLCKHCKEDHHPTPGEYEEFQIAYGKELFMKNLGIEYTDDLMIKKAVGCDQCGNSGYAGRAGLHECLEGTPELKRLIMQKALVEDIRKLALAQGMTTLKQDGIAKIFEGWCNLQQVLAVCIS